MEPRIPVVSNVTAKPVSGADEVRESLERQVCSPVLWEESIRWMIEAGHKTYLEPAPGKVLTGIMRKIDRDIICESADAPIVDEGARTS
jgi:[acyl-carrier-protein] S-malonyltransferase